MISSYFGPQFCDSPLYFAPVIRTAQSKIGAASVSPRAQTVSAPDASRSDGGQPSLRALGIEIVFGREGRLGTRTIRITAMGENRTHDTVSTVSRVSDHGDRAGISNHFLAARDPGTTLRDRAYPRAHTRQQRVDWRP